MTRTRELMVDASEPAADQRPEDEPTILDYARVLWGGRWLILVITLLVTAAAVGISLTMSKSYTAKSTLMPLGLDRGGGLGALAGALSIENPGMKLMAVLQSRTVAEDVVGKLNLEPEFAVGRDRAPTHAEVIESFQKRVLKVTASQGMIVVKAAWRDPELSAKIANTAVLSAARYLNEHSISTSFQILDEAVAPAKPSSPKIALNTAAAFVLSGFAAVCLVFIRQYLREVRRAESARAAAVAPSGGASSGPA
ncbi:MAG TPA: Wzz/FepE/Etk N-terminal domain-containing protein [Nitrospiria bacterium]|nr:Wzz/FepE/Etk N-terminal domain-containing protein [Nitrospiria bacterium]